MRTTRGFAVALLFIAHTLFATNATAAHITPVNTTFVASGPVTITQFGVAITCTAQVVLTTNAAGSVQITQMTFENLASCALMRSANLPWSVNLNGGHLATISMATLFTPFGSCSGLLEVQFSDVNSTLEFLNGPFGTCNLTGTLFVQPFYNIVIP